MMSWCGPKLALGERLILRQPEPSGTLSLILGVALAVASWVGFCMFVLWIPTENTRLPGFIVSLLLPIHVLTRVFQGRSWTLAVTDRRLLIQSKWIWSKPWDIPLDEVEDISMDHAQYKVRVRAGGREVHIRPERIELPELKQAIERARGMQEETRWFADLNA